MKEKIASYDAELNNIKLVVDKLVTKQNADVFDKICKMCNDLFTKVCDYDPKSLNLDDIKGLIGILQRLLDICHKLKDYKDYLVGVVTQNINALNQNKDAIVAQGDKETPVPPSAPITAVEEVKPEDVSSVVTLKLNNDENFKNAA